MELIPLILFISIALALLLYGIVIYNAFVRLRNNVLKAWSNIDVLLKQRSDEIPKLVNVCKGYMQHERQTLQAVITARSAVSQFSQAHDLDHLGQAETQLRQGVHQLFALAEAYPELKADQQFNYLQQRISSLENQIADRREFFNDSVTLYNTRQEEFPDLFIAKLLKLKPETLLVFAEQELALPVIQTNLTLNRSQPVT